MEYANDEIFQIRYNTKLNRLQMRRENWTSKFFKRIKTHKFLATLIMALFIFSIINFIMITNFFNVLNNL